MTGHSLVALKMSTEIAAPLALIMLVNSPTWVMVILIILMSSQVAVVCSLRPFQRTTDNVVDVLNNLTLVVILFILMLFEIKGESIKEETKY